MHFEVPYVVNNAAEEDISKGNEKVEEQPNLNHLDVGADGEPFHRRNVHACQDQHDCQVYSNCRFKVEWFEEVSDMANDVE